MRQYSRRERVLFAILGALVFAPTTVIGAWIYIDSRDINTLWGFLGGLGGTVVSFLIAARGRSTAFLERDVLRQNGEQ